MVLRLRVNENGQKSVKDETYTLMQQRESVRVFYLDIRYKEYDEIGDT